MLWSANRGWGKEKENGNLSMGCVGCSVGSVEDVFRLYLLWRSSILVCVMKCICICYVICYVCICCVCVNGVRV